MALAFIVLGAVFDFFDGMLARALNAYSPLGKELDSLADDVTFGVAPAMIVFSLFAVKFSTILYILICGCIGLCAYFLKAMQKKGEMK